ncbi:MAG: hypothetical protein K0S45_4371, partial [Nitrospira sp.]|nr:hypothetical protein [Nitrospira sp.]
MEVRSGNPSTLMPTATVRPTVSQSRLAYAMQPTTSALNVKILVRNLDFYYGQRQALSQVAL